MFKSLTGNVIIVQPEPSDSVKSSISTFPNHQTAMQSGTRMGKKETPAKGVGNSELLQKGGVEPPTFAV